MRFLMRAGFAGGRHATGWTRSEFLRRAAGGAGLFLLGGAPLGEGLFRAADAVAAGSNGVQRFVSRPDLRPMAVEVVHRAEKTAPGYLFLTPFAGPGDRGVMILDDAGELVWWHSPKPRAAMNLATAVWQGRRVLTWWEGEVSRQGLGSGECVIADEQYREIARFRAGQQAVDLHEFVLTRRGTALVTGSEVRERDLRRLGGPARGRVVGGLVQELEIPSGRVLFEWRSLDHVALEESHQIIKGHAPFEYFHVNSIGLMPDGHLLVSARNTWALYKIHRHSGRVIWRLGGKRSDFHMARGTHFYWQHDARSHGPHLLSVFDDGAGPPAEEKQSRALLLAVDERRRRVTLKRAYKHRPPLLAAYTGSVQLLGNRNVLVGWGAAPYLTEYARDGAVRLDMRFPHRGASYRALRFPWRGHPTTQPALVALPNAGSPLLYVSWNGATDVTAWQLLTGPNPTLLQPKATVPRTGFETRISPGLTSGYAAVTALNASGRPLAQSAPVPLT